MVFSKVILLLILTVITRSSGLKHKIPEYEITEDRLQEIRSELLYWFFDDGGNNGNGDYQTNIKPAAPQMEKDLNFNLPFYGFIYNYTRVSLNGYLEFTDGPETYTQYPLVFPRNYPTQKDPSFIGPFFSKMTLGKIRDEEEDQRRSGVYVRVEKNLPGRIDQFGVELRERLTRDIREGGVIGAQDFTPKHAIITTWKSLSFQGGIESSKYLTNTFQLVLATDESSTYAIFNYANNIQWTTHTEAGGDTKWGDGGVPAFIGFNGGYGTRAFEYHPYSQRSSIRDLTSSGCGNGFRGRHVFRIDGKIMPTTCSNNMDYICRLYLDEKNQGTTKNNWFARN